MKIERRKFILIIAAVIAVVLTGGVILLSALTGSPEPTPVETDRPTPTQTDTPDGNGNDDGVDVGNPDDPDAPPSDIYENDYSEDVGYVKLPDGFDGSTNPVGTVYDENWSLERFDTLACELSTKETVTERALQPLTDFYNDLSAVPHANAKNMRATIDNWLTAYNKNIGERPPGDVQHELEVYCLYGSGDEE